MTVVDSSQNLRKAHEQALEQKDLEIPVARNNLKIARQLKTSGTK